MKMTLAQNRRLHGLLNLVGLLEEKAALVYYFSAQRTESASELEPHQAEALIEHLAAHAREHGLEARTAPAGPPAPTAPAAAPAPKHRGRPAGTGKPRPTKPAPTAEAAQRMRRKLFAIGRAIGWLSGDSDADRAMNRAKLDDFLTRKSYLKKPLAHYAPAELPKLVSQFELIQKHYQQAEAGHAVKGLLAELQLPVTTKRPTK